jgi:hypothetical protein
MQSELRLSILLLVSFFINLNLSLNAMCMLF